MQALAHHAQPSGLFISPDVYDHLLLFEHSISAYYVGQDQESLDACNALLARPLPPHIESAVQRNVVFPKQRLASLARPMMNRADSESARTDAANLMALCDSIV
jgi:hypothetical protein